MAVLRCRLEFYSPNSTVRAAIPAALAKDVLKGSVEVALNSMYLNSNTTVAGDEVYTPFYAVVPLLEFLPKDKVIWCPFDEAWSAFYQLLREKGYTVIRSSLAEGQDFFTYEPQEHWDIMVSNPPFSKKDEVLRRAFSFNKPFALLLPVNSIQGKSRFKIFKNELQLLAFDARVDYHTWGNMQVYRRGNHFGSAYFCRDLLPTKLEMRELVKYDRPLVSDGT